MKLGRIGIVALGVLAIPLGALAAFGDNGPQVEMATPGVGNGAIERFTARFNQAMVPLGNPLAAGPFDVKCAVGGQGRWVDQQTYVHEFATPLPGGISCNFNLKAGLKSLGGYEVGGQRAFTVDSGGPIARAVLPGEYAGEIEEDQLFVVAANLAADPASVAVNAYCSVEGLGEKIPVEVLDAKVAPKLIADLGTDRWEVRSFLEAAGLPQTLPASPEARAKAFASVTALKCRRPLPPGHAVALIWGKDIKSPTGRAAGTDQRYDFTVRKPFTARFECSRVNPQAGCSPVEDAWVRFSAPIARNMAEAIRIRLPDGKELSPKLDDGDKRRATISDIKFSRPLPAALSARLVLPEGIRDESGRPLTNAERFPLDVRFDEAPPLVKFAAPFGILELKEGGVLPVTVRSVEPVLVGANQTVAGQSLKVDASDGEVADWLHKVADAQEEKYDEIRRSKPKGSNARGDDGDREIVTRINQTGAKPILAHDAGHRFQVTLPGQGKAFEVVGINLTQPGFYVVELASPRLGAALLGRKAPRYVAAGALVTNMAVHFKWGRGTSLAWVTALDTGKPVAGAAVQISDSCSGDAIARGTTDANGLLAARDMPEPNTSNACRDYGGHPLMISARKDGDFSFTMTGWGQGIQPYDFDLPYGWNESEDVFHTVFDRSLVRQGETVHMKHILRHPVEQGLALVPGLKGTLRLSHRGSDTQFDMPLAIGANGVGETSWTAPKGAPMGDYDVSLIYDGDRGEKALSSGQSFRVDEYKLPTMKASVAGPKDAQVRPKTLPLDLYVGYLSGGGAPNLPVELRVGYFASTTTPAGWDNYVFGGKTLKEGIKPLNGDSENDEDGGPTLPPTQTLPLKLGGDGSGRTTLDVPAGLDQDTDMLVEMDYQDANGEVLTQSRRITLHGAAVQLGLATNGWLMKQDDLRLKFVALALDGKPIANQRVSVELYSREILTARRRLIGGFYAYDNQLKTTRLGANCTVNTDAQGRAECKLDPGVSGEIYAVATTTDANGNVARATKSVWLVGDDAWWFGGDNGDRMDLIPEKTEYASTEKAKFQVRMPFRSATALVTVEREGVLSSFVTELSGTDPVVEVPMAGTYAPDVFVSVMVVRGRVTGWLSWLAGVARSWGLTWFSPENAPPTALVDLAKPSYRLGIAKVKVGWEAHRLGVSVKADKERYAARDTALADVTVKYPDGTPASRADVAFVAVDQALLQLAPNDSWDVLSAMMGERPLSVLTSTAQTQVVGKRHYGRKAVEAGGGGGGDVAGLNRENFQPVLLWQGKVALDANGHAQVKVPLNDALTSFKLVAVATSGAQLFGEGEASIRSAQDLTIYPGQPPLVRTGDWFASVFTLRNGSDKAMKVTASVELTPRIATGHDLTVTIPPGGAVPVAWNLTAPTNEGTLRWTVKARTADGKARDQVSVSQSVVPAVPVATWAATIGQVGAMADLAIAPPPGALPGRGGVDVVLTDTLQPPLAGVREFMTLYPYDCFEQRLSRAIALDDTGGWTTLAGEIPAYLDSQGLIRYFPWERLPGSESLTAYVLSITAEAGLPIPDNAKAKMLDAMKAVLDGRLRHEDFGDVRLQRVAAFAALARQGAATPAMLGQMGIATIDMPTGTLADYAMALGHVPGLANANALRVAAEAELRKRLVYEGTRIDLVDKGQVEWWLMQSGDGAVIKALLATLGRPGWQNDSPKMMIGMAMRQLHGRWDTTTANAWGTVAAHRFGAMYPASAVAGVTTASLGSASVSRSWPLAVPQRSFTLPLPVAQTPLKLSQEGGAGPWAMVRVKAAVPLARPAFLGYRLSKKVEVVQARTPGRYTRGDVVKVSITVDATAERNWVVVDDPIPAGATIVGDLANQSQLLAAQGNNGGGVSLLAADDDGKLWEVDSGAQLAYVERRNDSWRGFFSWVPRGKFTVTYVLRLNGSGRFGLPPTRVEAMYSPEINAMVPNAAVTVAAK